MNEGIHLDLDTWIVPGQIRQRFAVRIIVIIHLLSIIHYFERFLMMMMMMINE